ncbi:unnamed protein product, partial [Brassica oleracea]
SSSFHHLTASSSSPPNLPFHLILRRLAFLLRFPLSIRLLSYQLTDVVCFFHFPLLCFT